MEVEKDARDTRNESWKIVGSKREWLRLNEHIKAIGDLPQKDRANLIIKNLDGCVNDINDNRRSLGIIKPSVTECYFGIREGYTPSFQYSLFKRSLLGKKNFPLVPRIKYRCSNCKVNNVHDQQVIDWGFYEWLRKYPDKKEQVWKNARIGNLESDIYFLVGNQMLHRRSFMIISVLYIPKSLEDLNQAKLKLV